MNQRSKSTFNFGQNYYGPSMLGPSTLAEVCHSPETWAQLLSFHQTLVTDPYVQYLDAFYREGVSRFGANWRYMDIVNTLFASASVVQPESYLEIGVRRGRSVCTVARACPEVNVFAFDIWEQAYAGMENPGPEFVEAELKRNGHKGTISFINGDSHQTIPAFFAQNPGKMFQLITVDGDHSEQGAYDDLCNVIPHLAPGGVLVFDDIAHPAHPYLLDVWHKVCAKFGCFATHEFCEIGYGVAFAIKKA